VGIPVVDRDNFEHYKNSWDNFFLNGRYKSMFPCFVSDNIKGYKGIKPRSLRWQYGCHDALPLIKEIETIVKGCDLVIDIHNSCAVKFIVITNLTHNKPEEAFFDSLLEKLSHDADLYDGILGYNYRTVKKGLFESKTKNTILSYARMHGKINLALEVPVFDEKYNLRNFDDLTKYTADLLEHAINSYAQKFHQKFL